MGLTDRLAIKVSPKAFDLACPGKRVYGRLGNAPEIRARALLGEEIEDLGYYRDQLTDYRRFLNCTVEFAETLEQLKTGQVIKRATLYSHTVRIFC